MQTTLSERFHHHLPVLHCHTQPLMLKGSQTRLFGELTVMSRTEAHPDLNCILFSECTVPVVQEGKCGGTKMYKSVYSSPLKKKLI